MSPFRPGDLHFIVGIPMSFRSGWLENPRVKTVALDREGVSVPVGSPVVILETFDISDKRSWVRVLSAYGPLWFHDTVLRDDE
jgi:hypothetical protein